MSAYARISCRIVSYDSLWTAAAWLLWLYVEAIIRAAPELLSGTADQLTQCAEQHDVMGVAQWLVQDVYLNASRRRSDVETVERLQRQLVATMIAQLDDQLHRRAANARAPTYIRGGPKTVGQQTHDHTHTRARTHARTHEACEGNCGPGGK